jgi:hypothetical protein
VDVPGNYRGDLFLGLGDNIHTNEYKSVAMFFNLLA